MNPSILLKLAGLATGILLGVGWCHEREARKRDASDAVADSLARDTRVATERLAVADTVYLRTDRHFTEVRRLVDTVTLPPDVRTVIRGCDALQVACAERSRRSDSLIRNLRAELEHAQNPPPGPRLSYFLEGGYDALGRGAVVGLGAAVRLAGAVSLTGKIEGASQGSDWQQAPETRALVGLRITFK